jgi:hypothetical protein
MQRITTIGAFGILLAALFAGGTATARGFSVDTALKPFDYKCTNDTIIRTCSCSGVFDCDRMKEAEVCRDKTLSCDEHGCVCAWKRPTAVFQPAPARPDARMIFRTK